MSFVSIDDLPPCKLILDGVFFVDGGFAGPNYLGSWEATAADAYRACASRARQAQDFFNQLPQLTGATSMDSLPRFGLSGYYGAPNVEFIRKREPQWVGCRIFVLRGRLGDEATIAHVAGWADTPVPHFHKL